MFCVPSFLFGNKKALVPYAKGRRLMMPRVTTLISHNDNRDALDAVHGADPSPPTRENPFQQCSSGGNFRLSHQDACSKCVPLLGGQGAPALSPSSPLIFHLALYHAFSALASADGKKDFFANVTKFPA
jgi:hypothetical protein